MVHDQKVTFSSMVISTCSNECYSTVKQYSFKNLSGCNWLTDLNLKRVMHIVFVVFGMGAL